MKDWHVGQPVVCVDDSPCTCGHCGGESSGLENDKIYHIAEVNEAYNMTNGDFIQLIVGYTPFTEGVFHSGAIGGRDARFRPLKKDTQSGNKEVWKKLFGHYKPSNLPVPVPGPFEEITVGPIIAVPWYP